MPKRALLIFSTFLLWMFALPLEGFLLHKHDGVGYFYWYLLPHVTGMLVVARCGRVSWLLPVARVGAAGLAALTLLLLGHLVPTTAAIAVSGLLAAPVLILACQQLSQGPRPALAAALGLIFANLGLLALQSLPLPLPLKFAVVALAPLFSLLARGGISPAPTPARFFHYLPFVFVYSLVSGLMYDYVTPAYSESGLLPGVELLFYVAAVLLAYRLHRRNPDNLLAAGILCGMLAFTMLRGSGLFPIDFVMFTLQAGSGFLDLFLLACLLESDRSLRSFGYGLAAQVIGILSGGVLSRLAAPAIEMISMVGNLILTAAVLVLYFARPSWRSIPLRHEDFPLPPALAAGFSEREEVVLKKVLAGRTYRKIAQELGISESSVKTYMGRIYEKTGTHSKHQLFRLFQGAVTAAGQT